MGVSKWLPYAFGDTLENDPFDEIVSALSIGSQRKKAYVALRALTESALVIHDIIEKLEETNDEEDEMIMKALDAVVCVCEVFISTFEEFYVDESDSDFDPFDED